MTKGHTMSDYEYENTDLVTMPAPGGEELTLLQHVEQSTRAHPSWHELDHAGYLIGEVGFDGEYVQKRIGDIIHKMTDVRFDMMENRD